MGEGRSREREGLCEAPEAGEPGIDRAKVGAAEGGWGEVGNPLHSYPWDVTKGARGCWDLQPCPFVFQPSLSTLLLGFPVFWFLSWVFFSQASLAAA